MKRVVQHFERVDPVLASVITSVAPLAPGSDYFSDLCEIVIQQQLSEKAGETLWRRFLALFRKLTPHAVLRTPDEKIRSAGISWHKVSYIKNLATYGDFAKLRDLPDEDVLRQLTNIKGIGPWSAEMFLMFSLAREDVFSYGDLGLRRAIQKLYNFKREPTRRQMERIVARWAPYRTYAAKILWGTL